MARFDGDQIRPRGVRPPFLHPGGGDRRISTRRDMIERPRIDPGCRHHSENGRAVKRTAPAVEAAMAGWCAPTGEGPQPFLAASYRRETSSQLTVSHQA